MSERSALQPDGQESDLEVNAGESPGGQSKVTWYVVSAALVVVVGLGAVGSAITVFTPATLRGTDVDSLVRLSGWNSYIDPVFANSDGQCDRAALIHSNGSPMTSDAHAAHLKLTSSEADKLARVAEQGDVESMSTLTFEGVKYVFLGTIQQDMFVWAKKGHGSITVMKTDQTFLVAHTKEGGSQGLTNLAVKGVGQNLRSFGLRRLLDPDDFEEPVILELAGMTRAGFAGDDEPKSVKSVDGMVVHGEVHNWDDAVKTVRSTFDSIQANPEDGPVLLSETSLNPSDDREKLVTTMFETFKSPAVYLANNAALAVYASGRTTGVVLLIDEDIAHAVPVYEGHALNYAIGTRQVGSHSLTEYLGADDDSVGVHELVYNSIMLCDVDFRKDLYANIILAGPGTLLPDFKERLHTEISALAPPTMKIKVIAPPDRGSSSWIGGSILASLSTFQDLYISKREYDENGPSVVHYKCF